MTAPRSMHSSIEVEVDPATAFAVFTQELDCWWLQGPINFFDSARASHMRMEPGVGGRIVEVYEEASGEGLELGRITAWEPGVRVAWQSAVDDVEIDVSFEVTPAGTRVTVRATLPEGGKSAGGAAWVRMTPVWLRRWIERRDRVPREPLRLARLGVAVYYQKPAAAARWLCDVFSLEPSAGIPEDEEDPDHVWIEFHVGNCSLVLFGRKGTAEAPSVVTHTPWIFVDDLDAHRARAKEGGAVVEDVIQHGFRAYTATDLEGHKWTFAQASPRQR